MAISETLIIIKSDLFRRLQVQSLKYLENKPKFIIVLLNIALVILIGFIDYLIPPDIYIGIFYLIPILLTTRFAGELPGAAISLLSAITWHIVNFQGGNLYLSPIILYWNTTVVLSFFLTITYLVAKLRKAIEREKTLARVDYTTNLANKLLFFELSQFEIKRACRYGHPLTIAYIDIDDLKKINDRFGYQVGDNLLKVVAETLKQSLRQTDLIARVGGDEFAILLSGNGYESGKTVLLRVQQQLLDAMDKHKWATTFSIGAVTFINPPDSVNEMIEKADRLMYFVKNNGKNQLDHRTGL
jgi:diguanylate cyclase (GGDEF)-like protein